MKTKILTALLVACVMFSFAACDKNEKPVQNNGGNQNEVVQNGNNEDEEIDYEASLSTERYDGYNFRMLLRKGNVKDQYLENDSEDVVESATYRRNKMIESKYGITFSATESSAGYETDALNGILAGDDAYDIVFTHSRAAFTYAVQGAVFNINDIKTINTDMPWWSKDLKNSCDVNGYLYVLDGDITTEGLGCTMAMYFNKNLFDELGFDYPYELVKDGEWTFDEFAYIAKKGGADLNGNGIMEPEVDRYGFVTGDWEGPINIIYTGGQKIYDKNDKGELELTLYNNKTVDIFDEFFGLMNNEACYIMPTDGSYTGTHHFTSGRAMMATGLLCDAKGFRAMDDDFGIIPYPKFDEEDEYMTTINGTASLAVIPITVSDVERTGAIVEAMCAYGAKEVVPAFYDVSLKTKYARDDDSEEMLDLIKSSTIYDIGYVSGGTFQSIGRDLFYNKADFSSHYATNESSALSKLEDFNKDYAHFE